MTSRVIFGGVPGMVPADIKKMQQYILEETPEADFHFYGENVLSREELLEVARGATVLVSWDQPMDEDLYEALDLKAYCAASIGFDAANIKAASKNGVYVANAPDYCTNEVASHALAFILALYRRFYSVVDYVKAGHWDLSPMEATKRFENSTVGLVGFGRIPQALAKKLSGFETKILAFDPFISQEEMQKLGVEKVELEELFKNSDYISLHTPLLDSTRHLVNEKTISLMKDGVYLVNTARGALIDEEALYQALVSGKIRAAALDVLTEEPPSEMGRKLIELDNTIITPHSSYASMEASDLQIRTTAKNVAAFLRGQVADNTLNKNL